ncbi:Serine carboxypeptidase 44 [Theobroma cacao]|uniref:Serine carboxypeptidase 44 n=1 Tax=Theobroma cacao TaxID=3641 RepID=A0A061F7E9_THECC|nr:Serine carboxypeptidase 44 [Theobroma cacao]
MLFLFSPPPIGDGTQGSYHPPFARSDAAALGSLFLPLRLQPLLSLFLRQALISLAPTADPWCQSVAGFHAGDAGQGTRSSLYLSVMTEPCSPLKTRLIPSFLVGNIPPKIETLPWGFIPSCLALFWHLQGALLHYLARREFFASVSTPGCGSVGDGFLSVGPFITTANAHVTNLLFIDSPIGAGWSYSNTSRDYGVGDDSANKDLLTFILQWFEKYPNFKSRDLYLGGSSYAAKARCFDVLRDPCDEKWEDLVLGNEVTKVSFEVDMCIPFRADFYFNIPKVQKAFHGNRTNLGYQWKGYFEKSGLKYSDADKDIDMLLALKKILQQSIPITIFSGDQDAIVPTVGTLNHVNKLAKDMNLNLTKDEAWNHEIKDGGWMYSYDNLLNFITVKGVNHHVTFSKPSEALFIFTNIVLNQSQ